MNFPEPVSEWLKDKEQEYDSQHSYKTRKSDVKQFIEWLDDTGRDWEPVEQERHKRLLHRYFLSLNGNKDEKGYARKTVSSRWASIKLMYSEFAGFYAYLDETPFENLKKKSTYLPDANQNEASSSKPYITKQQKIELVDNVPSPKFRNEVIIETMFQTGLRQSSIANLKIEDVNLKENKLEEFYCPKVNDTFTNSFSDSLNWLLDEWINGGYRAGYTGANESDYLFLTHRSEKIRDERPNIIIKKAAENAGIQEVMYQDKAGRNRYKITSHAIRRGHAMYLWKEPHDVDLRTIQGRLNHSSLQMTMEYLPISPDDEADKLEGIQF
ncbi:site-specific integrase [Haloarchaeobius sp. FL176]|uniref:tyrosine-type recombinase/integrase n=1 Tax=Haloarchaeobius sp. FL176 TaxID=2967129 RepID=UPI00214811D5|nr:site-specific integrase [Haloarchaeobius sp. FL176]